MSADHPQLEEIRSGIDDATARARRIAADAGDRFFNRRPREGAWSVAECLAHLNLTTEAFLPLVDDALAKSASGSAPPGHRYKRDLMGRILAWVLEPPFRMKVKTTAGFVPAPEHDRAAIVERFAELQEELKRRVDASAGRDLDRIRVVSPFSDKVRYNLYSTFGIVLAHERRHLWQAERALAALDTSAEKS
jgi:hypothetical protein